jgi:hypothetical protein
MALSSPSLAGFRTIFRQPSVGLAEVAWRWSFGAAASFLVVFGLLEYFESLPVTQGEMLLLHSRQPVLISKAITQIFRGSGSRLALGCSVLAVTLSIAWIVLASVGRAATLSILVRSFRRQNGDSERSVHALFGLGSLAGLNLLRVATLLGATVGGLGALVFAAAISQLQAPPGLTFLVLVMLLGLVASAGSWLNWLLSLAAVFVVTKGRDAFGAISAAADICFGRPGPLVAVSTWFGLSHTVALVLVSFAAGIPIAFAPVLPRIVTVGSVLLATLLYFLVVDFLYIGRLASYVWIAEGLDRLSVSASSPAHENQPKTGVEPESNVDPDELILSDLPLLPKVSPAN